MLLPPDAIVYHSSNHDNLYQFSLVYQSSFMHDSYFYSNLMLLSNLRKITLTTGYIDAIVRGKLNTKFLK
jgi:hypothetical protein